MNTRLLLLVVTIACLSGCSASKSSTQDDYLNLEGNDSRVQSNTSANYDNYVYANSNADYAYSASPAFYPSFGFGYGAGFGYGMGFGYSPYGYYNPYNPFSPFYDPFAYEFGWGWGGMGYAGGFYYPYGYYPYYGARVFTGGVPFRSTAFVSAYSGATIRNNFRTTSNIAAVNNSINARTATTNRFSSSSSLASTNRLSLRTTNGYNTNDRTFSNRSSNSFGRQQQQTRMYTPSYSSPSRFGGSGGFGGGGGARFGGGGMGRRG